MGWVTPQSPVPSAQAASAMASAVGDLRFEVDEVASYLRSGNWCAKSSVSQACWKRQNSENTQVTGKSIVAMG